MEPVENSPFEMLIWAGTAVSLLGLLGLIWCIWQVSRAKRAKLPEEDMRAVLKKALPLNLGALFLSVIGLMMVIIGVFLV
ncbi:hypothetical protein C1J03_14205 [Sulfitobacter sp. SK012]|uniref:hypothetical protein n=1 Tax=Sulfitobacter sp. SK012 TaxID=1389005 RepID=UPI000E0CAC1A|nr:hypothetical protein C1J03_14205 [Sulfitobacter sp. SK012]